jgi:hypothetical protein
VEIASPLEPCLCDLALVEAGVGKKLGALDAYGLQLRVVEAQESQRGGSDLQGFIKERTSEKEICRTKSLIIYQKL